MWGGEHLWKTQTHKETLLTEWAVLTSKIQHATSTKSDCFFPSQEAFGPKKKHMCLQMFTPHKDTLLTEWAVLTSKTQQANSTKSDCFFPSQEAFGPKKIHICAYTCLSNAGILPAKPNRPTAQSQIVFFSVPRGFWAQKKTYVSADVYPTQRDASDRMGGPHQQNPTSQQHKVRLFFSVPRGFWAKKKSHMCLHMFKQCRDLTSKTQQANSTKSDCFFFRPKRLLGPKKNICVCRCLSNAGSALHFLENPFP